MGTAPSCVGGDQVNIRKADSKGRLTGFEPGQLYALDLPSMYVSKVEIFAPDGRPVEQALRDTNHNEQEQR